MLLQPSCLPLTKVTGFTSMRVFLPVFFALFLYLIRPCPRSKSTTPRNEVERLKSPQFPTDGFQNGGCFSEIAICLELSRGFCRERICHKYSSSGQNEKQSYNAHSKGGMSRMVLLLVFPRLQQVILILFTSTRYTTLVPQICYRSKLNSG